MDLRRTQASTKRKKQLSWTHRPEFTSHQGELRPPEKAPLSIRQWDSTPVPLSTKTTSTLNVDLFISTISPLKGRVKQRREKQTIMAGVEHSLSTTLSPTFFHFRLNTTLWGCKNKVCSLPTLESSSESQTAISTWVFPHPAYCSFHSAALYLSSLLTSKEKSGQDKELNKIAGTVTLLTIHSLASSSPSTV